MHRRCILLRRSPSAFLQDPHPQCWGLHRTPEVVGFVSGRARADALPIIQWKRPGFSVGCVKPAERAAGRGGVLQLPQDCAWMNSLSGFGPRGRAHIIHLTQACGDRGTDTGQTIDRQTDTHTCTHGFLKFLEPLNEAIKPFLNVEERTPQTGGN